MARFIYNNLRLIGKAEFLFCARFVLDTPGPSASTQLSATASVLANLAFRFSIVLFILSFGTGIAQLRIRSMATHLHNVAKKQDLSGSATSTT